jgi:hypothetical protein
MAPGYELRADVGVTCDASVTAGQGVLVQEQDVHQAVCFE